MVFFFCYLMLLQYTSGAQERKIYGRDFDYKTLTPTHIFQIIDSVPAYYVSCTYNGNTLQSLDIFGKEPWMEQHLQTHASVQDRDGMIIFAYDNGKTRSAYGRFPPVNSTVSDTAILIHDTLIFKKTTKYFISIHYATNIFGDSIYVDQKQFPIGRKAQRKSMLSDLNSYLQWDNVEGFVRYYQILITPPSANCDFSKANDR